MKKDYALERKIFVAYTKMCFLSSFYKKRWNPVTIIIIIFVEFLPSNGLEQ